MSKILNVIESLSCAVHTVSIIGLEPTHCGSVWSELCTQAWYPGLVGSRPIIDTVSGQYFVYGASADAECSCIQ